MSHALQPSPLYWGNRQVSSSDAIRYLSPGSDSNTASLTPTPVRVLSPRRARRISVRHGTPRGNGNTIRYRLLINGAPAVIDLFVDLASDGSEDETVLAGTIDVPAGATLDLEVSKPLGLIMSSPLDVSVTVELI